MVMTKDDPISLLNLGDGAAIEKFDEELQRVLDNIVDPNAKADAVREITLKVKFKPDENRNVAAVSIATDCKLAPDREVTTACVIGRIGSKGHAREMRQQQSLFTGGQVGEKVTGIDTATGEVKK